MEPSIMKLRPHHNLTAVLVNCRRSQMSLGEVHQNRCLNIVSYRTNLSKTPVFHVPYFAMLIVGKYQCQHHAEWQGCFYLLTPGRSILTSIMSASAPESFPHAAGIQHRLSQASKVRTQRCSDCFMWCTLHSPSVNVRGCN